MITKAMGHEASKNDGSGQIKTIFSTSLLAIIVLYFLSSFPGLYKSFEDLQSAKRVSFLNDVSDFLFTAVGNYGFERGRVNVVLNDVGPVEKMEANRTFIKERRNEADSALSKAFKSLSEIDLPGLEKKIRQVQIIQNQINELRQRTNKDLVVSQTSREKGLAAIWFAAMTRYIESIEALLVTISIDISDADGVISRYSSLKHEVLALRNTAGPEMSILSATILSQQPIKGESIKKIETLHANTLQHFQNIAAICQGFSKSDIPNALNALKRCYFSEYLPYRNETFPLAKTGGPYPYSQEEFLSHGVKALKEVAHFMDVIVLETKSYAASNIEKSWKQILFQSVSSVVSLLAMFLIMLFINVKVILPIGRLTSILRNLAKKQLELDIPFLYEKNEIGEMAKAVEVFRQTSIQLDKDNHLLRLAEKKIRLNEDKLKLILNSIPDMIIECDESLKVLWANKAALDLNPYAIGQTCYSAFPGEDRACDGCYSKKALKTGKIERGIMYQSSSNTVGESYWENIGIPLNGSKNENMTVLEVSRNVTERVKAEKEKEHLIAELQKAIAEIKTLSGLLPICSHCKKIRDDQGYWNTLEKYIHEHSEAKFSHSICQECAKKYYPDFDIYKE